MNTPSAIAGRPTPDPLIRLFDGSGLVGLTDGELLARFVATRDEAAFEGLVARLGPMVLGVARRMLSNRADADDAFQATFLVLVRRAGSVGRGDLIGPWLHGVAVRVCRQARAQASRRAAREQPGVSVDLLPPGSALAADSRLDGAEIRATIDAEIARLPASDRRLIILCDIEGLTRAEAADRLGWTPNMVRGRLARARTRLRANLARRDCLPPGLAAPTTETSALILLPGIFAPPAPLLATTARAALLSVSPSGRATLAATGLATTSALHLAEGVIRAMFLTSGKFLGASFLIAGTLATGTAGVLLAQGPGSVIPTTVSKGEAEVKPSPATRPLADAALRTLLEKRLRSAQRRQEANQAFYNEGRITIDRLIDADMRLMQAEQALLDTPEQRRASIQTYVDRLQRVHDQEVQELEVGRATEADVAEAADSLIEARIMLAQSPDLASDASTGGSASPSSAVTAAPAASRTASKALVKLNQDRVLLARKVFDEATRKFSGDLPIKDYLEILHTLIEAERAVSDSPQERAATFRAIATKFDASLEIVEAQATRGEKTWSDTFRMRIAALELEALAMGEETTNTQATDGFDRRLQVVEAKVDRILDLLNSLPDRSGVKR